VESDGPSGEYFITFPDDLLEAANLKEGDQIEWHDQGDGSFKLVKKVDKVNDEPVDENDWDKDYDV
jgi:bifunctional DNA-binding transcriptional regulator/antitoxin component of YhaV-PrlF toxin-antitoxin module